MLGIPRVLLGIGQQRGGVKLLAYTTEELQFEPKKYKLQTPEEGVGISPAVHATGMSEGWSDVIQEPYMGVDGPYVEADGQPTEKQSHVLTV